MIITLSKTNKTMSFHKDDCPIVLKSLKGINLDRYPYGYYSGSNQVWFSEEHITLKKIGDFFDEKDYGKILCSYCHKDKEFPSVVIINENRTPHLQTIDLYQIKDFKEMDGKAVVTILRQSPRKPFDLIEESIELNSTAINEEAIKLIKDVLGK
jgi:hypothetical protein